MMWSRALSKKCFVGATLEFRSANRALEGTWNSMLTRSSSTVSRPTHVQSPFADESEKPSVADPTFSRGNFSTVEDKKTSYEVFRKHYLGLEFIT